MADVTEAGATGRKPRTSGGAPAATAEGGDPSLAALGTAETAAQAAEAPVVIGAGLVPETPGGPGVGAAQTAERVTETVSRPLVGGAEADLGLRPLSEGERLELETLRRQAMNDPHRAELGMLRGLAASGGLVVDAARITGRRLARAATAIKQDDVLYGPDGDRQWVPVDFATYTQLVEIGAITRTPWIELDQAPEAGAVDGTAG